MAIGNAPPPPSSPPSSAHVAHHGSGHDPGAGTNANTGPNGPLHQHTLSNASTATIDVEAWTTSALESLTISPAARGTGGTPLSIPIDSSTTPRLKLRNVTLPIEPSGYGITPRRPLSRRDSTKRREELKMGKEGSRARRRWDNDHLLGVPGAQPPAPGDWLVRPTWKVLGTVPYGVAGIWERGLREVVEGRRDLKETKGEGVVSRELRNAVKKTPVARGWLKGLEQPVREFMVERGWGFEEGDTSEEDEEVVFVGRNGSMIEGAKAWKMAQRAEAEKGLVMDTVDDEAGALRRYLTHSISEYYGLNSKSVTMGNPARRVVYIGVKKSSRSKKGIPEKRVLPPPLWEML